MATLAANCRGSPLCLSDVDSIACETLLASCYNDNDTVVAASCLNVTTGVYSTVQSKRSSHAQSLGVWRLKTRFFCF